jgi:hypothetical protein
MFKCPPLELTTHIDSIAKHVEVIELEGGFSSVFKIVASMKDRACYHTLLTITANRQEYSIKGLDISIVYLVHGSTANWLE